MEARKIFERYWDNKTAIVMYQGMIESRKLKLMPSLTPFLSLTPKGHDVGSSVENTVIKWEEDEIIQNLLYKQKKAQNEIALVDRLLSVLSPKSREIITQRYIEQGTVEKIAENLNISESKVIRVINSTFEIMDNFFVKENDSKTKENAMARRFFEGYNSIIVKKELTKFSSYMFRMV